MSLALTNGDSTNKHRVEAFVLQHRPRPVCARCVATALGLRPSAVQRAATVLEGSVNFVRQNATCALCGKNRLVVRSRG
jgi:ribosomal protein S27AE